MRIRSIKPEFWKKQRMAKLSRDARLLFIGLWNLADDFGRFRAHPNLIKGELFAYDADEDVAAWLAELVDAGRVQLYSHDGEDYGFVRNFAEHQKIDKRAASRIPAPPTDPRDLPPITADEPAEPANNLAEPADFTPVDQGSGIRDQGPLVPAGSAGEPGGDRAAARGASASQGPDPEPEPETTSSDPPGEHDPAVVLQLLLMASPYRSNLPTWPRRIEIAKRAEGLAAVGMDPSDLRQLIALDAAKAETPGALLATWVDDDGWRDVLGEQAMKQKQRGARRRGRAAQAVDGDELAGIYGGDPKPASSVIADVLQKAGGGRG